MLSLLLLGNVFGATPALNEFGLPPVQQQGSTIPQPQGSGGGNGLPDPTLSVVPTTHWAYGKTKDDWDKMQKTSLAAQPKIKRLTTDIEQSKQDLTNVQAKHTALEVKLAKSEQVYQTALQRLEAAKQEAVAARTALENVYTVQAQTNRTDPTKVVGFADAFAADSYAKKIADKIAGKVAKSPAELLSEATAKKDAASQDLQSTAPAFATVLQHPDVQKVVLDAIAKQEDPADITDYLEGKLNEGPLNPVNRPDVDAVFPFYAAYLQAADAEAKALLAVQQNPVAGAVMEPPLPTSLLTIQ